MCLILLAYNVHPKYRIILAANRDEFYNRPTAPLDYWDDYPEVLAGRDLKGNGTWLGITRSGRIAAITNYREPAAHMQNSPSRGILIRDFLIGQASPQRYLKAVRKMGHTYNGFNLIAGDPSELYYYSNRATRIRHLQAGIYGISNHLIDTAWPKIKKGKALLRGYLSDRKKIDVEKIWEILGDRTLPPDDQLPDTGVGMDWERILSPLFIISPDYGTRSSSVVLMDKAGQVTFRERIFFNIGNEIKEYETRKHSFMISS